MNDGELNKEFFELLCYVLTSARGLMDEPKMYGPFRLVDTASRIISILEKHGIADDFLAEERKKIDEGKYSVMESEEKFKEFLDRIIQDFAEELKKS
ncbi:hypothetical protein Asulf_02045 [Archaeoglobus sulfaticallidus PM70-1]|uniref:Uncharacterized protein n=1 Tax=Archaeoglobus sulfaticallidus PM70-1 TaxID=387631 RepID=N0BGA7_9EURY|nr:DUF6092 family protein [Archaeoglobus sulfaticallidus]AGK62008.1 hypothetical protein Asulf_02045 [Archaeoglobus sulfaticallidus PM70-1]